MHGDFYKRNLGDQIWDDVIDRMKFIDPSIKIFFNDYQLLTSDYGQENLKIRLASEKKLFMSGFEPLMFRSKIYKLL